MCCVLPYHGDEGREADDGEADEDPNEKGAKKSCDSPHKEVVAFHPIDFDASTKEHPKVAESQKHFTKGKYDFILINLLYPICFSEVWKSVICSSQQPGNLLAS